MANQKYHRNLAVEIISALRDIFVAGYFADKVIERRLKANRKWGGRDRREFAETIYEIVRWWRWYWHLAGIPAAKFGIPGAITQERLWQIFTAFYVERNGQSLPFPECRHPTLEEIERRREQPVKPEVRASMPDWLWDHCERELGEQWPAIIEALNCPADVYLRANTLKGSVEEIRARLERESLVTGPVPNIPGALKMRGRRNVFGFTAFQEGYFEVQDAASQLIAPFLEVTSGMRVIDACAGAGGKALHLAMLMHNKGKIVALDVHDRRLEELRRRAARAGADNIETRLIEPGKTIKRLTASADRVLLDVPCSGLGVLRRNPSLKWKFTTEELGRLRELQRSILHDYSRMVKPGGKLVYATCSILPSENHGQVQAFLAKAGAEWTLEAEIAPRPDVEGFDGFYAARLVRAAG